MTSNGNGPPRLKIIRLEAKNIKRLKAVQITPDGSLVKITGANGQGKTSLLDSIWWALKGTANVQDEPIRTGEEKAHVTLDFGAYKVTRNFTAKGSTLIVENSDGSRFPSPQAMLDRMIGDLSFDPMQFLKMKPADQYGLLAKMSGLGAKLEQAEGRESVAFESRTAANRESHRLNSVLSQFSDLQGQTPEPVDMAQIWEKVKKAEAHNNKILLAKAEADSSKCNLSVAEDEVVRLRKFADARCEDLDSLGEVVATEKIKQQLVDAQASQADAVRYQARDDTIKDLTASRANWETLDKEVKRNRDLRKTMLKAASFPVDGLGLDAGVVTLNGHPLDQASRAEALRVSMAIAMQGNPDIRIIRVTDASLLDSKSIDIIEQMAIDQDFQIWLEIVDETKKVGIVIEDGQVVKVNK